MLFGWFGTVIGESEGGLYNLKVDASFRWAMSWFIFSEVMFFAVFFGTLFYARVLVVPWLAGEGDNFFTNFLLWPGFENTLAVDGSRRRAPSSAWARGACRPLNTAILLLSGVTITIAHHALRAGHRTQVIFWLAATFLLGFLFLGLQAEEYIHAYTELNLRLDTGIYGGTFFMLTGFHGLHVTLGAIMLADHLAARAARPLQARPALRVRGRGLVLALRRRGVARPVLLRLLDLAPEPVGLEDAEIPAEQQQQEEQDREADADRQRSQQRLL